MDAGGETCARNSLRFIVRANKQKYCSCKFYLHSLVYIDTSLKAVQPCIETPKAGGGLSALRTRYSTYNSHMYTNTVWLILSILQVPA